MPQCAADATRGPMARWTHWAPWSALAVAALVAATVSWSHAVEQPLEQGETRDVDWLAVLVGPSMGTLEPCGCAGGMLGGIDRLATAISVYRSSRSAPSLTVGAGGQLSPEAIESGVLDWQRAQLEAQYMAYDELQLDALVVSSHELALPIEIFDGTRQSYLARTPLVASNLFDGEGAPLLAPLVHQAKTGVTVLGFPKAPAQLGEGREMLEPKDALARLGELGLDLGAPGRRIVLVEGDAERAKAVGELFAPGDLVAHFGERADASATAAPLGEGAPYGGFLGARLRHVVSLRASGDNRLWEKHPVAAELIADERLVPYRGYYREFLSAYDVVAQVGDTKGPHPRGAYAGSASCQACHTDAHAIWSEGQHPHGLLTLQEDLRGGAAALVDPDCVRCHSVGFGYETGFASKAVADPMRLDPKGPLGGIGCESCHGPAAQHVVTGLAEHVQRSNAATCMQCHDVDNDPNFDFERKWPLIVHDNP
ncbi:MAG: hypothetical protein GC161_00950 [Planctomycetaceae bacterium]|nr:hypothetical protein [Planctomycetaceae bacterium]